LIMKQAGMALFLAKQIFGDTPEKDFLEILDLAQSNDPAVGTGWAIFEREVRPVFTDLTQAAANFAMSVLFQAPAAEPELYNFSIKVNDLRKFGTNPLRLASGDIDVTSKVTLEGENYIFGAMRWGEHNLSVGISSSHSPEDYSNLQNRLKEVSAKGDCADCLNFLHHTFPGMVFGLQTLFKDERAAIIDQIFAGTLAEAETAHREIFDRHRNTMRFLASVGQPAPPQFTASAAFVINNDLMKAIEASRPDLDAIEDLLKEAKMWGITPDKEALSHQLAGQLETQMLRIIDNPDDDAAMINATGLLQLFKEIISTPNLWRVQNLYFAMLHGIFTERLDQPGHEAWRESFEALGTMLNIKVG
jgi:hypothetical protein